ncbi:MAG: TonB-dependent receptor, partial [Sphingobacteriales bacterium]
KQTALAPKFGVVYQPLKDNLSVFGNIQSSFTNVANAISRSGKPFKPEKSLQMEAGVKMNLLGDVLTGSVSYYHIKVNNVVRPDSITLTDPTPYSIQNGEQKSNGYEIELIALPVNGLSIVAGYSHNNSKLLKATADVEGLRPTTAGSADLVNFWVSYQFNNYFLKGFSLGFGGNYASETYPVNSNVDGKFILPSYTVLNSAISYQQRRFKLTAKLNNITNEHYWVGYNSFSPQMTRQFIGALTFRL